MEDDETPVANAGSHGPGETEATETARAVVSLLGKPCHPLLDELSLLIRRADDSGQLIEDKVIFSTGLARSVQRLQYFRFKRHPSPLS